MGFHAIIARHGIAEDAHPDHPGSDHERRLTPRGVLRTASAARGLRVALDALGLSLDGIRSSPHVRARQTADLFADVFAHQVHEEADLSFAGSQRRLIASICAAGENVLLVGHQPLLADLVAELVSTGSARLEVRKAAVFVVRIQPFGGRAIGTLVAHLPPRILRSLDPEPDAGPLEESDD